MKNSLLLIEDEILLGNEIARYFQKKGWEVRIARDLATAKSMLENQQFDPLVIVSDMNLPDGNALDFMAHCKDGLPRCEWLFLTGFGSVSDSVRAVRLGAYDFIEKPCDLERLNMLVEGAARSARIQRRLENETQRQNSRYTLSTLSGKSPAMQQLREMVQQMAKVPFSSLIITGETGTGKGLIAKVLHYSGRRANMPLIEINCAALPHELLEAELFGYEAGAFTGAKKRRRGMFELAHSGTLFLDEIGEMDLELQGKLLKAVEELRIRRLGGEQEIDVDVQIIAATHQDLRQRVKEGRFREDLYHRLNVINIQIPPLRDRMEDLPDLVHQFIAENNTKSGKQVRHIPDRVWHKLENYDWPGNVRELRNIIERCVLLATDEEFPEQWLQLALPADTSVVEATGDAGILLPLDGSLSLQDMEKFIIQKVLEKTDHNVTAAARMLGTTRETLRYRVQKYHLTGH